MSEQNKLVKTITDSAVRVGISAGIGYLAKKNVKRKLFRGSKFKCNELYKIYCPFLLGRWH